MLIVKEIVIQNVRSYLHLHSFSNKIIFLFREVKINTFHHFLIKYIQTVHTRSHKYKEIISTLSY